MPEPKPDANTLAESSPADSGAPAAPPPATDANKAPSWEEFTPTTPAEPAPSAAPVPPTPEGETPKPEGVAPKAEAKPEGKVEQDDTKLPFHEHPRWKEVLKERDELKQASEAVKPYVEQQRRVEAFIRENHISEQQYMEALQFMALRNVNPAEAFKMLKPMVEELQRYEGEVLPQDLQEMVDRGALDEQYARKWAKDRAQAEFTTRSTQQTALQREQQAQAEALTNWENGIRAKDPDYTKKAKLTYSRYVDIVSRAIGEKKQLTAPLLVEFANQAYQQINDELSPFLPTPRPTTKTLTSTTSPRAEVSPPKNWDDIEDFVVNQFTK